MKFTVNLVIPDLDQTAEIREAFRIFDRDGNGFIDSKELKHIVTQMGQVLTNAEADEFMLEADLNGDGKLDFDEFMQMMLKSLNED
jgi:calmodulin